MPRASSAAIFEKSMIATSRFWRRGGGMPDGSKRCGIPHLAFAAQ
jgi:hypothetical protein